MNVEERRAMLEEGSRLKDARQRAEALELWLQLEKIQDEHEPDARQRCLHLNRIAYLSLCCSRWAEAERAARKCVELYRSAELPFLKGLPTYLSMLAGVLAERGKFDEAVPFQREANELHKQFLDPDSSYLIWRHIDLLDMQRGKVGRYIDR